MADPAYNVIPDRDVQQALLTLKKGTQLIKYSRKGKPKLCPFRLSTDETTLIWFSHKKERTLSLASVIRIIPGQRTVVFRRYLRPEKDYLSFSLIYKNGERSLDLICKDQAETEAWFTGLKALISTNNRRHSRLDSQADALFNEEGCESVHTARSYGSAIESTSGISGYNANNLLEFYTRGPSLNLTRADVASDHANMQLRSSNGDVGRLSISSAPSSSSQGSGPDDIESLGDVYVWGELWSDGFALNGTTNSAFSKADILLPKPLESNVVLDVQQIACGVKHAALLTRQGEIFTWGEECGGQLGHGSDINVARPQVVESLAVSSMDYIACGESHTCAVSTAGDLFTWGDGSNNQGLLGHGTDVSHWIPKRVSGPLEGLQVLSVACGTRHTALVTLNGKIYTFGDGMFGALGHGDRESVAFPKEVQSLSGLRTIKVACGVWHTAAIVEVIGQAGANVTSRKLFTWGDGDKYRLGHGDKEARLLPTCVPSLIDYNFHQLACGHSITVGLTTSGHVFTMGSTVHGQLGNPQSDGKIPCLVQDRLVGELVEEIACGASHVAVLTSRTEVYTWGKGANGRLGHGDTEDRRTPTLVEALKDRHVKSISCGSSLTACICIHKWVSGADQSVCSGCRQAFGFTRKRHNCYNCGLVHCHACSSRKVLKAALAPTPGKPHRVCDSCHSKLKAAEAGNTSSSLRKHVIPRRSVDTRERSERIEPRSSRVLLSPLTDPSKHLYAKLAKNELKTDSLSLARTPQVPSLLQLKDIGFPSSLSALQTALKPIVTSTPSSATSSRPTSPYARKQPSPPHSTTPVFSKNIIEALNHEVLKLQNQVKNLKQRCEIQDVVLQKAEEKAEKAASRATEESEKCNAAVGVIKSIDAQLIEIAEKLPPEMVDSIKIMHAQTESYLKGCGRWSPESSSSRMVEPSEHDSQLISEAAADAHEQRVQNADLDTPQHASEGCIQENNASSLVDTRGSMYLRGAENGTKSPNFPTTKSGSEEGSVEQEQFEPGVYITYVRLQNGTKLFKRVMFSKRRFAEQQAEDWWSKNKDRVFRKYKYPGASTNTPGEPSGGAPEDEDNPSASEA